MKKVRKTPKSPKKYEKVQKVQKVRKSRAKSEKVHQSPKIITKYSWARELSPLPSAILSKSLENATSDF